MYERNVCSFATVASFSLLCCSIWCIFFRLFLASGCFPFVVSGEDYISARMALIRIFRFWQGRVFIRFSVALNDVFSPLHQGSLLHRHVFLTLEPPRRVNLPFLTFELLYHWKCCIWRTHIQWLFLPWQYTQFGDFFFTHHITWPGHAKST